MSGNKKIQAFIQLGLLTGILIFVNILASFFYSHIDLTEDQRFTLADPTQKMVEELDDVVSVRVMLEGEFPAGFKRLQRATREMLDEFRSLSPYIDYEFENPNEGTVDEINQRREALAKQGINPINLRIKDVDETKELIVYPWAVLYYKGRQFTVNLLESEALGMANEAVLNNSVSLLEYKFANAIQKLQLYRKRPILFLHGHGELEEVQTADLRKSIKPFYNYGDVQLDTVYAIKDDVAALIIAKPRLPFSERDKFVLDQYIMNGGKILWMIDPLNVNLDSLRTNKDYVPMPYDLNLKDMLFKYGVRIQENLVLDLNCTGIPLVTSQSSAGPKYDKFDWYYHPLVMPASGHPIVKSLDLVNLRFPSTIDTVRTKTPVEKTFLLSSSERSRTQNYLTRLNFEILRYDPDPSKFNKGPQPVAVLLEGQFPSLYQNRVADSFKAGLEKIDMVYKEESSPTRMLVVTDGDIAKNLYNPSNQKISPIGFNPFERKTFGANKDFVINAIEYLLDNNGVIESRSKEVKLRLLDTTKAKTERLKWRLINILLPLFFLLIFGIIYQYIRRRRFAQP